MNYTAFFPGQGAQHTGMGLSLFEESSAAKTIFECAGDISGQDVKKLCFEGEMEALSRTVNSQIAIFTVSMAAFAVLKERGVSFDAYAGFSLGEYTALAASGICSLEDGMSLVCRRGQLMQQAADETNGAMYAILGLDDEAVEAICKSTEGIVLPVNYNCPGQLVIAGEENVAGNAAEACKAAGAKRAMRLPVSGAFHTPLMKNAASELRSFAEKFKFNQPDFNVYTNLTGEILKTNDIPAHLEAHMVSPVRWKLLTENMLSCGHNTAMEIGPGKTLTGFSRKISKELTCHAVETMEDILSVL